MMEHMKPETQDKEYKIVSSIKVVEEEIEIKRPTFVDIVVERPIFHEKQVDIPVGLESLVEKLAISLAETAISHVVNSLEKKLDQAIDKRLTEVQVPKIIEQVNIVTRDVFVDKPIFKEVEVQRAVVKDVEVLNAVVKDVLVNNAIVNDIEVNNPVFKDVTVINPVFKDITIDRPVYVDKEIIAIHPKYIDLQGRELKNVS